MNTNKSGRKKICVVNCLESEQSDPSSMTDVQMCSHVRELKLKFIRQKALIYVTIMDRIWLSVCSYYSIKICLHRGKDTAIESVGC
jgi:hypothetical protein